MPDDHTPLEGTGAPAPPSESGVSRRSFIQTLGVSAAAGTIAREADSSAGSERQQDADAPEVLGPDPIELTFRVNGQELRTTIEPATTLLDALRLHLDLTGSKEVCDRGSCGGCSILVDGRLIASCMMLAIDATDSEITTIEGLASGGQLDPIQESFIRHDALQCGFCTPGLIMASKALLNENPSPSLEEIKRGLAGNLCRCGTYTNVFNAVLDASGQPPLSDSGGGEA